MTVVVDESAGGGDIQMENFDVIVIGAGFSGSIAAQQLSKAGHRVLVLEARDRIGGRTWYKNFGNTEHLVEFGGTWVVPEYQPHIKEIIDQYNLELVESPSPQIFTWLLAGGVSHSPWPIPVEEWMDFERAISYIDAQAARIKFVEPLDQAGLGDLDIPFEEFVDKLNPPPATREFILSWAGFYFGNYPANVSALHILSWVAGFDNSSVGWYVGVSKKFEHGTRSAIEAIHADSNVELRLLSPVSKVEQGIDSVTATTRDGEVYVAKAAIVATPINTWSDISFEPALTGSFSIMANEKQGGQSIKVWALVRGLAGNFYGVGWKTALKWVATEYVVDEGQLIVGFGCSPDDLDVEDHVAVSKAIREYLPEAEVVAVDAHDWNGDEFAQGTWMAYRPGQVMKHASSLQQLHDRVAFASSDLASGWAGWMDGALESGKRAARAIEALL
ncbi:MAG TPA: NAD(P)/FAD-dependent oxidoreductase [Acidimicrobiales bacterium]